MYIRKLSCPENVRTGRIGISRILYCCFDAAYGVKKYFEKEICNSDSNHSFPMPGNKPDRAFNCLGLGKKRVSGITYIRVGGYWDYPTTILGLADRKIVGWSLSKDMTAQNTVVPA